MLLHQVAGFLRRVDTLSQLLLRASLQLPDIGINLILELITQTDNLSSVWFAKPGAT